MSNEVMDRFGLPSGRYPATLQRVEVQRNGKRGQWHLDLEVFVIRNGKVVGESRKLGKPGPYDLTPSQRKALRAMGKRLGVQDRGPVEEIVASIQELVGQKVTARIRPHAMGGLAVVLYEYTPNGSEPVTGDVLDRMPKVEPELREVTQRAQGAHEQLLMGLHHAHRGLALAAQACHRLRLDEGWVALGYDSVGQYLADPDLSLSRTEFFRLADIWEQYIERGGQDEKRLCASSKLEVPLPALKAGDVTADEALADAESLGLRDLRAKYRGEDDDGKGDKSRRRDSSGFSLPPKCSDCGAEDTVRVTCTACGVMVDAPGSEGIVYHGHRWPAGWSHEQVMAAYAAGEAA